MSLVRNKNTPVKRLSGLAQAIFLREKYERITDTAELVALTGYSIRAIQEAKRELRGAPRCAQPAAHEAHPAAFPPVGTVVATRAPIRNPSDSYYEEREERKQAASDLGRPSLDLVSTSTPLTPSAAPDPLHGLLATVAGWYDAAWLPADRWSRAKRTVARLMALHGSPTVLAAVGELAAQIDTGVPVARPLVVIEKVCQRIKAAPAKPHIPPWEVEKRREGAAFLALAREGVAS